VARSVETRNDPRRAGRAMVGLALTCLLIASCTSPWAGPDPSDRMAPSASGEFTFDQPLRTPIDSVIWTDAGYVAIGSGYLHGTDEPALQAWRSDDGFAWTQIHLTEPPCCTRDERFLELVDSPLGLMAWTTGRMQNHPGGDWHSASFLRSSNDGGRTWTEHSSGPWNVRGVAVERPHVIGSTVLIVAAEHDASTTEDGQRAPSLWRSDDLESWERVPLPNPPDDGWIRFSAADDQTYLVMAFGQFDDERSWYVSTDRGATFDQVSPPHPDRPAQILGVVAGRFIVTLEPARAEWDDHDGPRLGPVLATSSDGLGWTFEDRNTGLWGDAQPRLDTPALNLGVLHVRFARTLRQDIRYCIADVSTCRQHEQAVAVIDGQNDTRELLVDISTFGPVWRHHFVWSPQSLLVWFATLDPHRRQFSVQAHRWDDLGPEHVDQPAPLDAPPEPPSPILRLHRDVVPIGQRFHTQLPIGHWCGDRFSQDDRWYLFSGSGWPLFDEIPPTWPFQPSRGLDGPMGYLFVEGERSDADTFRFFIDRDTTVEYRYDPHVEAQNSC
jgi:hypothetical protein